MNKKNTLLLAVLLAFSSPALAADDGKRAVSFDFAAIGGLMWPDFKNADPGIAAGFRVIVSDITTPSLTLEGEVLQTFSDGEIGSFDFSLGAVAGYLVWRSAGNFNWKIKGGALYERVDVGDGSESDSGLTGGVGIGFDVGRGAMDIEANIIEEDVYFFNVAYRF